MTAENFPQGIRDSATQNPKYLAFYLHNFRFYFSWFSIALWCFMILFVLGFFSFNKNPQLLSNPKILSYREPQAFGPLPKAEAMIMSSEIIEEIPFGHRGISASNQARRVWIRWSTIILPNTTIYYHIWEQQIPKLSTNSLVGKIKTWNSIELNQLIKHLHLPEFTVSLLKKSNIDIINFSDRKLGYQFSLDLTKGKFWLEKQHFIPEDKLQKNKDQLPENNNLSDKSIKKSIKKQISSFWLSLKYYWEPNITLDEYDTQKVHLFYPKLIDKKTIRDKENLEQEGMFVSYDLQKQEIISLQNFQFQAYELSEYPITKTKKTVLDELSQLENIDNSKKWTSSSISMKKGQEIYLKDWEFLMPWLLFLSTSEENQWKVFLPLY